MVVHFESDASGAWNEMFSAPGVARPMYQGLLGDLTSLDMVELGLRAEQLSRTFIDRGVTFAHSGEERPFPLDLVPRIIGALEWDHLSRGIAQRVRALEAFLDDLRRRYSLQLNQVYGHREIKPTICPGDALMAWLKRYRTGQLPRA